MGPLDLLTSRQALAQPMGLRSYDDARRRARSVHGPFESITIRQRGQTEYDLDADRRSPIHEHSGSWTHGNSSDLSQDRRSELGRGDHAGATGEKGAGHAAAFAVRFGAGAGHGGIADGRSHSARR